VVWHLGGNTKRAATKGVIRGGTIKERGGEPVGSPETSLKQAKDQRIIHPSREMVGKGRGKETLQRPIWDGHEGVGAQ